MGPRVEGAGTLADDHTPVHRIGEVAGRKRCVVVVVAGGNMAEIENRLNKVDRRCTTCWRGIVGERVEKGDDEGECWGVDRRTFFRSDYGSK